MFLGFLFQVDICHLGKREKQTCISISDHMMSITYLGHHFQYYSTFIWCVWRPCYLTPQLCEVLVHQIYFNLVFTRL